MSVNNAEETPPLGKFVAPATNTDTNTVDVDGIAYAIRDNDAMLAGVGSRNVGDCVI